MATNIKTLDQTALKTGQALTIILLLLAFLFDSLALVAFVALAQLLGALGLPVAPYRLFYVHVVRRFNLARPNPQSDHPEPHRFSLLVGTLFNGAGTLALLAGLPLAGWALVWIVIALANLNFWLNFCLGCWIYYRLNRVGVPGFTKAPLHD